MPPDNAIYQKKHKQYCSDDKMAARTKNRKNH